MEPVRMYNWNDLPKDTPRPGIDRVAFRGDNAMAVMNWIKPGHLGVPGQMKPTGARTSSCCGATTIFPGRRSR